MTEADCQLSGEQSCDRNPTDSDTVDHERNVRPDGVIDPRSIPFRSEIAVYLDMAIDQIDDPVNGDVTRPIAASSQAVLRETKSRLT
jgi:hypothetical protein